MTPSSVDAMCGARVYRACARLHGLVGHQPGRQQHPRIDRGSAESPDSMQDDPDVGAINKNALCAREHGLLR